MKRGESSAQGWTGGRADRMSSGFNGKPPPGALGEFSDRESA